MQIEALIQSMSPQIYDKLREAVETGKWLDGNPLSDEQQALCMQAVLMYQSKVMDSDQHMTVNGQGEVVHKSRQELKQQFAQDEIARFKQDDF